MIAQIEDFHEDCVKISRHSLLQFPRNKPSKALRSGRTIKVYELLEMNTPRRYASLTQICYKNKKEKYKICVFCFSAKTKQLQLEEINHANHNSRLAVSGAGTTAKIWRVIFFCFLALENTAWETGVSRHNGGLIEGPLKFLNRIECALSDVRGREGLHWAPIMPRDASVSDSIFQTQKAEKDQIAWLKDLLSHTFWVSFETWKRIFEAWCWPFSSCFSSEWNSVYLKIKRKTVNTVIDMMRYVLLQPHIHK